MLYVIVSIHYSVQGVDEATIKFSPIPEDIIQQLLNEKEIFSCAGGLMIENPSIAPYIQEINGSTDSVMGFSASLFFSLLNEIDEKLMKNEAL